MRMWGVVVAALLSLALSAPAWAIVQNLNFTPTNGGKPLPGATVSINVVSSPKPTQTQTTATTSRTPTRKRRMRTAVSSPTGQVQTTANVDSGATFEVIVTMHKGQQSETFKSDLVTLAQLTSGGYIPVAPISPVSDNGQPPGIPGMPGLIGQGPSLAVSVGGGSTSGPGLHSGTYDLLNVDHPVTYSKDNLTGPVIKAFGNYGPFYGYISYGDFRGSANGSVPIGMYNVGLFYIYPFNGSNGVGLGAAGLYSQIDSHVRQFDLAFGRFIPIAQTNNGGAFQTQIVAKVGIVYSYIGTSHTSWENTPTFNGIYSMENYDSSRNFIAPGFNVDLFLGDRSKSGLFGFVGGQFAPGYTWANLSAFQHNWCDLCPAAQQDFTLSRDFHESSFAFKAGLTAGVGFNVTDRLSLGLYGNVEYFNKVYGWDVPYTANNTPIQATYHSQTTWSVGGGAVYRLSDARLKRDIAKVGHVAPGIELYRYRYKWSDQVYVGVMAQEVAQVEPDAVMRGPDGYLRVNYARTRHPPPDVVRLGPRATLIFDAVRTVCIANLF